jgi:hypothetical protein
VTAGGVKGGSEGRRGEGGHSEERIDVRWATGTLERLGLTEDGRCEQEEEEQA